MMKVAEVINKNSAYLAEWVTREQGKPLGGVGPDQVPGARFEVWGCEVWTQVPASLDLPVELAFEDDTAATRCIASPTAWSPPSRRGTGRC